MKKVLHVVYNLTRGGTEGQCAQTALKLSRAGWPSKITVFSRHGFYLEKVETNLGLTYTLPIRHIFRCQTWRDIHKWVRYIQAAGIQLIHTWDADSSIFGAVAATWLGVPLITSRRDLGEIYPPWKVQWMKMADHLARRVIVNANIIRDRLLQQHYPERKIVCIPNLFDMDSFDSQMTAPFSLMHLMPAGPRIVMVARLDAEKDAETVIKAVELVSKRIPSVKLIIAGEGPQRGLLETRVTESRLRQVVTFLGEVEDVPSLLKQCHIGVLMPKANEGLSNSILEYMAASLPVVVTDCGGNKDLVCDETGCVVPVSDFTAAARALIHLLQSESLCQLMGVKGRAYVMQMHSPARVLAQFQDTYESIFH